MQTFWGKKSIIRCLKRIHGASFAIADFENRTDNNPFTDEDKFNGYEEAMDNIK